MRDDDPAMRDNDPAMRDDDPAPLPRSGAASRRERVVDGQMTTASNKKLAPPPPAPASPRSPSPDDKPDET